MISSVNILNFHKNGELRVVLHKFLFLVRGHNFKVSRDEFEKYLVLIKHSEGVTIPNKFYVQRDNDAAFKPKAYRHFVR